MCTGMEVVGLLASAAGPMLTMMETGRVQRDQSNAMGLQIKQRGERQRAANNAVKALLDKQAQSNPDDPRQSALDTMMQRIKQHKATADAGLKQAGGVSDAYSESAQDAALGIGQYGGRIADMLTRIDAPGQQRQGEAIDRTRYGSQVEQIKRLSEGDDYLAKLRMMQIQRRPHVDMLAGALKGAGGAMAGGVDWSNLQTPFGPGVI